jgi:Fe2+ or Zn2+ uptake regulation protein
MEVVNGARGPIKRRKILEELERRGHRISLAGLNRILEVCSEENLIISESDGVRATTA